MTVHGKTTVKATFETGDRPTGSQFVDFVDSYQDRQSALDSFGSAAPSTFPAVLGINASAPDVGVTAHPISTAARTFISADTTSEMTDLLGVGAVGSALFEADTTASAVDQIGMTTLGTQIIEADTTASAQGFLNVPSAGTTAQAAAGANVSAFMTPDNVRFNPFAVRAYATFTTAAILQSQRVSSVTHPAAGRFQLSFVPALPTADYTVLGLTKNTIGGGSPLNISVDASAGGQTVSGIDLRTTSNSDALTDPAEVFIAVMCSGE